MNASDYLATFLHAQGVTHVFEVIGGMIAHILDSVGRDGRIRLVSMHHEQGAAFAAEGMARMTGIPGVAMATSGPGATNLLTGIGSCYFDSVPAVFITGQVNRSEQKGGRPIRQLGFQETDIVAMAAPITKAAWKIQEPAELPAALARAFKLALSGRPGPVLVDIPMDVQRAQIDATPPERVTPEPAPTVDEATVRALIHRISVAQRPLILLGGGVASGRAWKAAADFASRLNVPVVSSLLAVDALPFSDPKRVGLIGSYGNRWANLAIGEADLLLVLGSRLDVRQTGSQTAEFKGEREIWHVDCDAGEINNRVTGCRPVIAQLRPFLETAARIAQESGPIPAREEWFAAIRKSRAAWPDELESGDARGINPNTLMHQLSVAGRDAAAFVVDVGQHQMWAAQSLRLGAGQRFLTSGGMGAMGFALPAALGAAFAAGGAPVVMIAGDGGVQLNIQELQTLYRTQLPLKLVVLNNGCHGMVRQFQQSYFEARYQSTLWGYSAPSFAKLGEAYGIRSAVVEDAAKTESALAWLFEKSGPALLEVKIDLLTNAYPKIAFGRPMTEMEPHAKPLEMEGT